MSDPNPENTSFGTINPSEIPSPYPTIANWLSKLEVAQKKKSQPMQVRDWDGICSKFKEAQFSDKHINKVYHMGLRGLCNVFSLDADDAAFIYEQLAKACAQVKELWSKGMRG
jgi:hypothetical protein